MNSNKPKNGKDKAKENSRSNGKGSGGEIIKDSRFSSANWDPKFREAPKYKSKVKIDSRFSMQMLKNPNFAPSKAPIDKRGKQKLNNSAFESLNRYYRIEGEEGSAKRRKNKRTDDSDSDTEIENENGNLKTKDVNTDIGSSKKIKENEIKESHSEEKKAKLKLKSQSDSSDTDSEEEEKDEIKESHSEEKKVKLRLKSQSDSSDTESESEEEEEEEKEEEVEEDSDDSSTSLTDMDDDQVYKEEEDTFVQQEDNIPEIDKETHRLAVVNMDWSHVKAVDLFVVLSSFLPKGGHIKSVAVYPSEFGLKRMEEEAIHGPIGVFDNDERKSGDDGDEDDDDDDDVDEDEEDDDEDDDDDGDEDDEDDDEIDKEKLRVYELSRLRYYFAVVDCDSVATADYLYKGCDGVEFERSSVKLDLRFIPDSMEFKHQSRDVATEAPVNYEGLDFFNRALQHSNINLTWDDDEPHRVKALKRKFTADQLAELELKEFLASDESGSDDNENDEDPDAKKEEKQNLYRALVQSGDGSDENIDEDDDENQDMEVTFNTGLEDLSKRILEKKDAQSESVWESYLRKRREKKKARKNRSKNSSEDESGDNNNNKEDGDESDDDFFVEESSEKRSKKKTRGKAAEKDDNSEAATRAELELLITDDDGTGSKLKGYNMKRKKKGKTGKESTDEGKLPAVDYEDPRFSSLFSKPHFALDPTDPQFKRSAVYARQLTQKQEKVDKEEGGGSKEEAEIKGKSVIISWSCKSGKEESNGSSIDLLQAADEDMKSKKKEKAEISSMVRSLKMKTKHMAPHGKVSNKGVTKLKKLNSKFRN